jgi:hypothetical protein
MLLAYIQEVLGLNLGQDTGYAGLGLHGFPQPLQADARIAPRLAMMLPSGLLIQLSCVILPVTQHC